MVQSQISWKGVETCRYRREEASLCPWWHGQTTKVSQSIYHLPARSIGHFYHWPLTPVYESFYSMPISFLLLLSVPVLGEEPALPQPLFLPTPWQTPEHGTLGTFSGTKLRLIWGQAMGVAKAGQLVGMDAEVCQGGSGGGHFPTTNTPCPGQCLMRGPWRHVVGSGAALVQGWVTGGGHNTMIRRWKQGQAMKEEF